MIGQLHVRKVIIESIHDRLHDARGIGGGTVTVYPSLGMDDIRDAVAGAAHGHTQLVEGLDERLHLRFVRGQELDVVTARKTEVAVTVFVGNIADIPYEIDADEPWRAGPHRVELVSMSRTRVSARRR